MSELSDNLVIIGAGHAGTELAFRARQGGFAGSITLVGAEPHYPYQRPPLSKSVLEDASKMEDGLILRTPETFTAMGITLRRGTCVTGIDRTTQHVALQDGSIIPYTWLALATGGQARRLQLPGMSLGGLHVLRTRDDALALRASFGTGKRLVIVGAGYIGLEVAAIAAGLGLDVTVVEAAQRVLARVAGPGLSAFVETQHKKAGVTFKLGSGVEEFLPSCSDVHHVGGVRCTEGTALPADLVLVAAGLVPETGLAKAAGLPVGNGVLVDAFCRTEDPRIFALGDNAAFPLPGWDGLIRLESVPNAYEHARVAASIINGAPSPYNAVPWFWSDQGLLHIQAVGVACNGDQEIQRPQPDGAYAAFFLREGQIVAAECVNAPATFISAKKLVAARARRTAAQLSDPGYPLRLPSGDRP